MRVSPDPTLTLTRTRTRTRTQALILTLTLTLTLTPDPHPSPSPSPFQARRVTRARPAGAPSACASSPRPPLRAAPPVLPPVVPPVGPRRARVRVGLVALPRGGGGGRRRPAARGGRTSPSPSRTGRNHGVSGALTCALTLAFARTPKTQTRTPTLTLAPTEP